VASAIQWVATSKINIDQLMTHHFPLSETQATFEVVASCREGVIKAMINLASRY
jgi:threonine dehydrogenase-like Zn-dependent dehydrogenase